jgi:hypothetical protein
MPETGDTKASKADDKGLKGGLDTATLNAFRNEVVLQQQSRAAERGNPSALQLVGEVGHSALYSGLQAPVTGFAQLVDKGFNSKLAESKFLNPVSAPEAAAFGSERWYAQTIGGGAGMALPFMFTKGVLKSSGLSLAARAEGTAVASTRLFTPLNGAIIADGAITGGAYDFFLTPVQPNESNFWAARTKHGLIGAATFGTLTAGSVVLGNVARPFTKDLVGAKRLAWDATAGGLSGVPAGIVNADAISVLSQGRFATAEERVKAVYTDLVAGSVLSTLHKIPGQDISPGEKAMQSRYSGRKSSGTANLEAMLAERARETKITEAGSQPGLRMVGAVKDGGSAVRVVERMKPGRAMASADVEGRSADVASKPIEAEAKPTAVEAKPIDAAAKPVDAEAKSTAGDVVEGRKIQTEVKPEQQALLQNGVNIAFRASEPGALPEDMAALIKYAQGEGAPVMEALLKVAKDANDPALLTVVREAYLPLQGVEHRVVEGEARITPEEGKPVTQDQLNRWQQFNEIVADPPVDVDGYSKYRTDLFNWLDRNPDLHSWVQQLAKQNSWSHVAGPLDFYFQTNELARFMDAAKPAKAERVERSVTVKDVADMRQFADEFADQVYKAPYETSVADNFRALAEKSGHLNVPILAKHINAALKAKGHGGSYEVQVDSNWQMTLFRPKDSVLRETVTKQDYASVESPVRTEVADAETISTVANQFGQSLSRSNGKGLQHMEFLFADTVLNMKNLGVPLAEVPKELNHVLRLNKMNYEVVIDKDGHLALQYFEKSSGYEPMMQVAFGADGKAEVRTGDQIQKPKAQPESKEKSAMNVLAVKVGQLSQDLAAALRPLTQVPEVRFTYAESILKFKATGIGAKDVQAQINHAMNQNNMPYEVIVRENGKLDLIYHEKDGGYRAIASVAYEQSNK